MKELSLDHQKVLDALLDAVLLKGRDYVYPNWNASSCAYLEYSRQTGAATGPSCIVGYALINSGIADFDHLERNEGTSARHVTPWAEDDDVTTALQIAQTNQDQGETWGLALDKCLDSLDFYGYDTSRWRE